MTGAPDHTPRPAVGEVLQTPSGRGVVIAVDDRWATVAVDMCGFAVETAVRIPDAQQR